MRAIILGLAAATLATLAVFALWAQIDLEVARQFYGDGGFIGHDPFERAIRAFFNITPFLVLASTGPLVQAWFARAHPTVSPYPLYAVSNFGSLGLGSSTPSNLFSLSTQNPLYIGSTTASSTFANGINIQRGCFSIGGTCIGGSAAASGIAGAIQISVGRSKLSVRGNLCIGPNILGV